MFPGAGLLLACILALIAGIFLRNFFGNLLFNWFEAGLQRIPFVNSLYKLFRQISDVFFGANASGFKKVVLVRWPHAGVWTIGFVGSNTRGKLLGKVHEVSKSKTNFVNIFVPTTPNPTSGFYFIVAEDEVVYLDIGVEAAFKTIVSCGTIMPDEPLPGTQKA